jgi:hypothetical protein
MLRSKTDGIDASCVTRQSSDATAYFFGIGTVGTGRGGCVPSVISMV